MASFLLPVDVRVSRVKPLCEISSISPMSFECRSLIFGFQQSDRDASGPGCLLSYLP